MRSSAAEAPALVSALLLALAAGILIGRAQSPPIPPATDISSASLGAPVRFCVASWYGSGEVTATGERFDPTALTAASRTLPFGSRLLVTELGSARSVVVHVNDRGPYVDGRCLDLSRGAFARIAPTDAGLIAVRLEMLPPSEGGSVSSSRGRVGSSPPRT